MKKVSMREKTAITPLGQLILAEMKNRNLSMRKFAESVGVSHATISRLVSTGDPPIPDVSFLAKLSKATQIDICTLVALVAPDAFDSDDLETRLLAARIRRLREDDQTLLESYVINAQLKHDHN